MGATFKAIPHSVCLCLTQVTSQDEDIESQAVSNFYPEHAKVFEVAGLSDSKLPTFGKVLWKFDEVRVIVRERDRGKSIRMMDSVSVFS